MVLPGLACTVTLWGCVTTAHSIQVHRPVNPVVDRTITQMWTDEVRAVARDGDWILSRSYYFIGDVVSTFTSGEDLSHASIYSATSGTVIEAVSSGVREVSLEQLMERNHHVIVVRPNRLTASERSLSVQRARGQVGGAFDVGGMFGFDDPNTFYCSELVYWAARVPMHFADHQAVITPGDLMAFGQVVYWSGRRDDSQVQRAAAAHVVHEDELALRAAATFSRRAAR